MKRLTVCKKKLFFFRCIQIGMPTIWVFVLKKNDRSLLMFCFSFFFILHLVGVLLIGVLVGLL